jgi:Cu-Zn family superoxide dismutase
MKNTYLIITTLFLFTFSQCKNNTNAKSEKSVQVKVERSESGSVATITTVFEVNGEIKEEIQTIEGTHEEVMAKVEALTAESNKMDGDEMKELKTIKKIQFSLDPKSGSEAYGMVTLTEENGSVLFEATLTGLSEGTHAIHIHEQADCSAENGSTAGGHWNPTFENHGAWGDSNGYHRGDIGNFVADALGNGNISFQTDLWCLGCDDPSKDLSGKAVIVHEGADDLTSQPSGDAGARVSCAGIIN